MTQPDELDRLFDQARAHPPEASADFMDRVLADALREQPAARSFPAPAPVAEVRPGWWARLMGAVGGGAALAGIGSAAMAGLMLGYVQPDPLVSLAGSYGLAVSADSGDSFDLMPGYDSLLSEE